MKYAVIIGSAVAAAAAYVILIWRPFGHARRGKAKV
jgi:hypothetical protein